MIPEIDPRERRYLLPTRVLWRTSETAVTNPDCLLRANTGQATLYPSETCNLKRVGDDEAGILLDFGREWNGGIQIVVGMSEPRLPRVRIRFGESVGEAMGEPDTDHANHDLIFPVPRWGTQEIGNTGFRFVRIDLPDPNSEVCLIAVRMVTLTRPLPPVGRFSCSDHRLNEIWRVGAHTVHQCLQEHVWDGIKRDRLVWIGDMHPEVQVISAVWGNLPIVPESLDYVRAQTPLTTDSTKIWMNGISSYSIWWLLLQRDWFRHWGDRAYLEAQQDYLIALTAQLIARLGEDGRETLDGWRFLDWPTSTSPDRIHAGLHALLVLALEAASELLETLGATHEAASAREATVRARTYAPPLDAESKQSSALLSLAGLQSAEAANREVLALNPLRGLSTFYGYYVLQARALAGDYQGALDVIRAYWGAMLDLGATTFWEDFDLSWTENAARIDELTPPNKVDVHLTYGDFCYKNLRHSLCHGWAAGPTAWLSEHVLGVSFLNADTVTIQPHLGDLEWAEGTVPTRHGPLIVRHRRTAGGTVTSDWDAPEGLTVTG